MPGLCAEGIWAQQTLETSSASCDSACPIFMLPVVLVPATLCFHLTELESSAGLAKVAARAYA